MRVTSSSDTDHIHCSASAGSSTVRGTSSPSRYPSGTLNSSNSLSSIGRSGFRISLSHLDTVPNITPISSAGSSCRIPRSIRSSFSLDPNVVIIVLTTFRFCFLTHTHAIIYWHLWFISSILAYLIFSRRTFMRCSFLVYYLSVKLLSRPASILILYWNLPHSSLSTTNTYMFLSSLLQLIQLNVQLLWCLHDKILVFFYRYSTPCR